MGAWQNRLRLGTHEDGRGVGAWVILSAPSKATERVGRMIAWNWSVQRSSPFVQVEVWEGQSNGARTHPQVDGRSGRRERGPNTNLARGQAQTPADLDYVPARAARRIHESSCAGATAQTNQDS